MRRYFIFILILIFSLSTGCAVLNTQETGSMAITYSDDEIKSSISSALLERDPSQADNLNVYTFKSHVFLIGGGDPEFRSFALNTARGTKGVKDVFTHWIDEDRIDKMQDAMLAADIDGQIFLDAELSSTRMAVEVVNSHVVLCGVMANEKSVDKVIAMARGVPGVRSVTSYLIY